MDLSKAFDTVSFTLGANSNYEFAFPLRIQLILGVTIEKDLSFDSHISQICEKADKQFSVLKRFENIRLYKACILPRTPSMLLSYLVFF